MKTDALIKRITPLVPTGETVLAATKAMPRGSVHEVILGGAGAVAAGGVSSVLYGAGAVAGSAAGSGVGDAGRAEREAADLDVGKASQILLAVTDQAVLLFALSALGRPKDLTARLDRLRIASVQQQEAKLFGQTMMEIVITTVDGAEVGFGIAKVHRRHGEAVLAVLA